MRLDSSMILLVVLVLPMKLSISLPDKMALEIKSIADHYERNVSWYIQKAWQIAREQFLLGARGVGQRRLKSLKMLKSLRGSLKSAYPDTDSVSLARQAFFIK